MFIRRPAAFALLALAAATALGFVLVREHRAAAPEAEERIGPHGRMGTDPGDWFYLQRRMPDGSLPQERWDEALQQAHLERARTRVTAAATSALVWQNVGPYNIGGRVTALAVPAGQTSTIYLGSANGGVWKSVNSGANWTCLTDNVPFYSVGALAVCPQNINTIYCGSGEANGSVDSYDGNGLWISRDAGATWANLGLTTTGRIARVVVDPADSNHVLVAAMGRQFSTTPDRGVYQTLDGGQTWTRTLYVSDSTGVTDLVINPAHPDTMFCATWERVRRNTYRRTSGPESGVWRSIDRGTTWTRMTTGLPTPTDSVGRIQLAVAPSKPSTVYAQVTTGYNQGYVGLGFYRSIDGGSTWSRRSSGGSWSSNFGGFAWYFGDMGVDPLNADHVWSLGVSLYSSANGGTSWSSVNGSLHADQHAIWVDPTNGSHVYMGNDGGFWWSTNGTSWTHSSDLPISQFYDGDVSSTSAATIYGGLQDNNTVMTTSGPSSYGAILGGDGFHVLCDPVTPSVVLFEYQNCCSGTGFARSTNGGSSSSSTSGWTSSDRWGWDTPITINPRNHNVMLAGSQYAYRSTNNGVSWSKISGDLSSNPVTLLTYGSLTTMAISAADTSVYWAGTDDGKLWRSTNRGSTWTDLSAGLPGRWVTRVTPDPADPQVVYASVSGFTQDAQAAQLFRSADQGATWSNISANLPNVPVNDIKVDPTDVHTLYAGTDLGVWVSRNTGGTWYALGAGMPLQSVLDLKIHDATRQLFAFTHGRSAWKIDLSALPAAGVAPAPAPALALSSPWPNPAKSAVRIALDLGRACTAQVVVWDVMGRRIAVLHDGPLAAGRHELGWDLRTPGGAHAAAGVYFVRATAGGATRTQRLVIAG